MNMQLIERLISEAGGMNDLDLVRFVELVLAECFDQWKETSCADDIAYLIAEKFGLPKNDSGLPWGYGDAIRQAKT